MGMSEDNDRMPSWQWHSGEPDVEDIPIPDSERATEDRDEGGQPFRNRRNEYFADLPDLKGRTLQEVEFEAARIKNGEYFKNFRDFQRCLDSWCVLNGRVSLKFKTRPHALVRLCRFSKYGRSLNRGEGFHYDRSDARAEEGWEFPPFSKQDGHDGEDGESDCGATHDHDDCGSQNENQNCPPNSQSFSGGTGNEFQHTSVEFQHRQLPFSEFNAPIPLASLAPNLQQDRLPFGELPVNTLSHRVTRSCAPEPGQLRSVVPHTREWIPASFPALPGVTRERKRKTSKTGACGELSRFLCPDPESGELDCPFRVRCSRLKISGKFKITVCDLKHTCPRYKHKWRGPSQKSEWLGETLAPRVVRNVKVLVRELQSGFQMDYKKTANSQQLWRAKDLVRDWWAGGQQRSFHQIPALLDRIEEVDPNCVVDWDTMPGSRIFKRAFICPSATRNSLAFCQPVISLDACHTKNRKYPTQLFIASVLDGNSRVHILAYAIAPVENEENWTWFLELLSRSLHGIGDPSIPFVSDRQKGLQNAVREVFPGKVHAHCCNHLRANVKKGHGQAAADFFIACVYASTKRYFDKLLERLERSAAKGTAAVQYINTIEPKNYARYAFPLPRFGKITSNPCEQANAGLLVIREFAPFRLLVELWLYIQKRFRTRYAEAMASTEIYTEQANSRLEANLRTYQQWQVLPDVHNMQAQVRTTDLGQEYLVSLVRKPTCSCTELQEMLWPCQHIMAWDDVDGRDYTRHFADHWKVSSLRRQYEGSMPCFLSNDLDMDSTCFPPEPAVKKGRHRVVRIERGALRNGISSQLGEDEFIDSEGNLFFRYPLVDDPDQLNPIPGQQAADPPNNEAPEAPSARPRGTNPATRGRKCRACGQVGHNRRTCGRSSQTRAAGGSEDTPEPVGEGVQSSEQEWDSNPSSQFVASTAPTTIPNYQSSDEEVEEVVRDYIAPPRARIDAAGVEAHGVEASPSIAQSDITGWDGCQLNSLEEMERWISWAS